MRTEYSPIERVRAEIDELFASDRPLTEVLEEVARLSVRLIMQSAVEGEVNAFLGPNRYQRRPRHSSLQLQRRPAPFRACAAHGVANIRGCSVAFGAVNLLWCDGRLTARQR